MSAVNCKYQIPLKSCALICFNTSLCSTSDLCDSVLSRFIIYLLLILGRVGGVEGYCNLVFCLSVCV